LIHLSSQESPIRVLIIGGTRNLGLSLVELLCERGHSVTAFNRGVTSADLPAGVERLYGDRSRKQDLERAIGQRSFDVVIDTTLYTGADALAAIEVLKQRTGHYIFISTGQVYLIRKNLSRPFREEDYDGDLITPPAPQHESDYRNWLYGINKREAEDHLFHAWEKDGFPITSLRAPMINGERDHYGRILGYLRRMQDGGPILLPEDAGLPLRHVYCPDVARAAVDLAETGRGRGRAFNLSQDETVSLDEFLVMLAELVPAKLQVVRAPRTRLEELKLLPNCSPFSGSWMSGLDNRRSKEELGVVYTPLAKYLASIVMHYKDNPKLMPEGYEARDLELQLRTERIRA
jgi:nucleoside-diphosphate-sugar epimerase